MKRLIVSILTIFLLTGNVLAQDVPKQELVGNWEGKFESRETKSGHVVHENSFYVSIAIRDGIVVGVFNQPEPKTSWETPLGFRGDKIVMIFDRAPHEFSIVRDGDKLSLTTSYADQFQGSPRYVTATLRKKAE
jgi:hypothetical protein